MTYLPRGGGNTIQSIRSCIRHGSRSEIDLVVVCLGSDQHLYLEEIPGSHGNAPQFQLFDPTQLVHMGEASWMVEVCDVGTPLRLVRSDGNQVVCHKNYREAVRTLTFVSSSPVIAIEDNGDDDFDPMRLVEVVGTTLTFWDGRLVDSVIIPTPQPASI